MPQEKEEPKKEFKKSEPAEVEWKADKSQIVRIEEALRKMGKEEKK